MKFVNFLKNVFISKFWIKAISLLLAALVAVLLNMA